MEKTTIYIYDDLLRKECDRLPTVLGRASVVTDLINSYKLLDSNVTVTASIPATDDELKFCHTSAYLEFIKTYDGDKEIDEEETDDFGLTYDCPLLPRLYNLMQVLAGASITAAKALSERKCDIAVNWFGGWHHAQRDEAEGFCYVNDIVIAIQELTKTFSRVLYVDLDVHHGNGVQNAFELSKRILTLSFHKYSVGFYPGSGDIDDVGKHGGKYYSINVPLHEGCGNRTFLKCFSEIFPRIFDAFRPLALVIQCGGDCINGDPVGQTNTTPKAMGECIKTILQCEIPTLFLGGGGYNRVNTARYWTYLTALILDKNIDNDIPDCSNFFTEYGPTYELHIDEGNQKDYNTNEYVNSLIETIVNYCNLIKE